MAHFRIMYHIIKLQLLTHSCVHHFNVAAGEGGAITLYTAG